MSTQRIGNDPIIGSGIPERTARSDGNIISSSASAAPQIISSTLAQEINLNGTHYRIEKLIARSGEAEIFLVRNERGQFILKSYYSQYKPKDEVVRKLKGLTHPDIITLLDYGYYQDRFCEISEYAQGGTLLEIMPVTSVQKIKEIADETIEALSFCHNHGIIHRDIKPENIFYRTIDKKDIAIGDFGIASHVKEGDELVRTSVARTSLYAAPELFTNIQGKTTIEKSVDYYALGMTLLHLWFGRNPFEDIDEFGIMRLKSEGRVLFPDNIDEGVKKLIMGLITVNPRDRWDYEEVRRWLKGEDVKVLYQTLRREYSPYAFGFTNNEQIVARNPKELAICLEKYPEKGMGHLYRNTIARWLEPVDQGLSNDLMDIVEKDYPRDRDAGLTKAIYILDPERPFKGIDGVSLLTQEEIALHFEQHFDHYIKELQKRIAPFYLFLEARNYQDKANEYRGYFNSSGGKPATSPAASTNPELALNALILTLQGADRLIMGNRTYYQPDELLAADADTRAQLIEQLANVNSKLSLWIGGFKGLQPSLDKWRLLRRYDDMSFRYALNKGFELDGLVANDKAEFFALLKSNYTRFFMDREGERNQVEAAHWLSNYAGTSFVQILIDCLKSAECDDSLFLKMLDYALSNCKDAGMDIYQVLHALLDQFKNGSELSAGALAVATNHIRSLAAVQGTTPLRDDRLIHYLAFADAYNGMNKSFIANLTSRLDDWISDAIRKEIGQIRGNKAQIETYRSDLLPTYAGILKKINPSLPWLGRYEAEKVLISANRQSLAHKNEQEKWGKLGILNTNYNDLVQNRVVAYKRTTHGESVKVAFAVIFASILAIYFFLAVVAAKMASLQELAFTLKPDPIMASLQRLGYILRGSFGSFVETIAMTGLFISFLSHLYLFVG